MSVENSIFCIPAFNFAKDFEVDLLRFLVFLYALINLGPNGSILMDIFFCSLPYNVHVGLVQNIRY